MDEKNAVIAVLREELAKASALVDKLDELDEEDFRDAGLLFCDLGEFLSNTSVTSVECAAICAEAALLQQSFSDE